MKRKQSRWRSFCFAVKKNKHLGQLTFQQEQTQNISAHFIKIITENYRERQSASVGNIIQNKNLLQISYEKQVNHFTQEVRTASFKGIWPHSRNTLMEANTTEKNRGAIMSKEISGIKKKEAFKHEHPSGHQRSEVWREPLNKNYQALLIPLKGLMSSSRGYTNTMRTADDIMQVEWNPMLSSTFLWFSQCTFPLNT